MIGAKEITQKASPEIVVVQLKDPKSFRPYILYTLNISEEYYQKNLKHEVGGAKYGRNLNMSEFKLTY